jgi:octanoyl-[GcvH]:protein N-octanoyltransferase
MQLLTGRVRPDDPALDMAVSHALLRHASSGVGGPALRVFRPAPMVAFGRRDANRPGFPEAVAACRSADFMPVVRAAGGRAVACTSAALVIDHIQPDEGALRGVDARFEDFGVMFAGALGSFGIDARVGEVPGEYCPGAHSINARGLVKLVGTAQRMVRGAWLFSSVVMVDDADAVRPLLAEVYDALGLAFDPGSVGSVRSESPAATIEEVERRLVTAYGDRYPLIPGELSTEIMHEGAELAADHRA